MIRLLLRAALATARRHPWQTGSAAAGIALGVAVASGMGLAVESARRAFLLSNETVMGRATHVVEGGPGGLSESLYPELRRAGLGIRAAPVLTDYVSTTAGSPRVLQLVGIDPVADRYFRAFAAGGAVLMTRPGAAVMSEAMASALGLAPGGRFSVDAGGRVRELRLVAVLPAPDAFARASLDGLVVTDVATAQDVLGVEGRLSRLDLIVEGDPERVRAVLPPGVRLAPAGARARGAAEMTRAFEFNLRMLSLLAFVVAGLLVYNSVTFLVLERHGTIGVLRALGVTRAGVFAGVLAEAALLGAVGGAVGAVLGTGLAAGLTRLVLRTVNDLYFVAAVEGAPAGAGPLAAAAALGLLVSTGAAVPAARSAAASAPRALMRRSHVESRARRAGIRGAIAGAACAAAAGLVLGSGQLGYAGLAAALGAAGFLAPFAVRIGASRPARRLPAILRLAAGSLAGRSSRAGVAAAALSIAMGALVGVSIMVESFRVEVTGWLESTLGADFYLSRPAPGRDGAGAHRIIDAALADRLAETPGVAAASRQFRTRLRSEYGEIRAVVIASDEDPHHRLRTGAASEVWRRFRTGDAVVVSEPFASRYPRAAAEGLVLMDARGAERPFAVAGVYQDFASEHGTVLMSAETYTRYWAPPPVHGLGLRLAGSADRGETAARLAVIAAREGLRLRSAGALRDASLAVFDRTFRVTEVLRWLVALAAGAAVLGTMLAMGLERGPELALLRALGLTRRGLFLLVEAESALMGTVAGVIAVPLGVFLAAILVHVVNRRAFGWSMELVVEPLRLAEPIALAVAIALAAGLLPAWRAARPAAPARGASLGA